MTKAARLVLISCAFVAAGCGPPSFPEIQNWKLLRITLIRGSCLGRCPAYSVEIRGDGLVRYQGRFCVTEEGIRLGHISSEKVRKLARAFKSADFLSLRDHYGPVVLDAPSIKITFQYDRWHKVVGGPNQTEGMPAAAARLPALIDDMASAARWIGKHPKHCL